MKEMEQRFLVVPAVLEPFSLIWHPRTSIILLILSISSFLFSCSKSPTEVTPPTDIVLTGRIVFQFLDLDARNSTSDAIWSIDLDDTSIAPTQLLQGRHFFSVSPNGKRLAYINQPSTYTPIGTYEIHKMSIAGGQDSALIQKLCRQFYTLDWSPDANKLVFDCYLSGMGGWAIFAMSNDGTGYVPLTDTTQNYSYANTPKWSPDGRNIAYHFRSPVLPLPDSLGLMSADGSSQHRLWRSNGGTIPRWSLDAQRIAFAATNAYYGGLAIADLGAGTTTEITPPAGQVLYAYSLDWLPDGRLICVAMNTSDSLYDIDIIPARGNSSIQQIVTGFKGSDPLYASPSAVCSSDGQVIYVIGRHQTDDLSLYVMRTDGSNFRKVRVLSSSPTASAFPGSCSWVPK